jgi:uncharacterized protein (DUF2235 family)
MPKRLVICCDGTWNTPDERGGGVTRPTNVTKLALSVLPRSSQGVEQRVFYHRGVGTGRWDHIRGGALGVGLSHNVQDAYRFLVQNYEPDDEIFLFGFSRGAFTARSTAGLVYHAGVLRSECEARIGDAYDLYRQRAVNHIESVLFRRTFSWEPRITFIGVWDTVGALGIPLPGGPLVDLVNKRWGFHDTALSPLVDFAFHALAIDERRGPFTPTLWTSTEPENKRVEQVWFSGVHSDVGGGYPDGGLGDVTLTWMMKRATQCSLELRDGTMIPHDRDPDDPLSFAVRPDPLGEIHESRRGPYLLVRQYHRPLFKDDQDPAHQWLSSGAFERFNSDATYRPPELTAYLARHSDARVIET